MIGRSGAFFVTIGQTPNHQDREERFSGSETWRFLRNAHLRNILFVVSSVYVFGIWIWGADTIHTSFNGDPRSPLAGLIYGTAHRPFVERVLIPVTTRTILYAIPESGRRTLSEWLLASPKFVKEAARLGWDTLYLPEYVVSLSLSLASLIAFPFAVRRLVVLLYVADDIVYALLPIGIVLGLPPFFLVGTHYIYDFPSLLLFTLGFVVLMQEQWLLFYSVYVIGCLNKETMVFLAALTLLIYGRQWTPVKSITHLAAQILLFVILKILLGSWFSQNPGNAVEFHLWGNIHNTLLPYPLGTLVLVALICFLVVHDFGEKPRALRKAAWLLLPFAMLMFIFGWINEARDLYEIYPVYGLLIAHTLLFSFLKVQYRMRVNSQ
jgi:hypothetical protein